MSPSADPPAKRTAQLAKRTPLYDLHVELGAKMVTFAGYDMPINYSLGVLGEHNHTRAKAGLFDVSHMGQIRLWGDEVSAAIETLVPADIQGLEPARLRYTMFTNDAGGILDDVMITGQADHLFVVVNAACKDRDIDHLRQHLAGRCEVEVLEDRALMALQGPAAASVMARHALAAASLRFMAAAAVAFDGIEDVAISRSGYTGEDGFEISVPAARAEAVCRALLAEPEVEAIGLGARDSLRLEAGLCLYGHDLDESTTPVEAGLAWTIGKRRRTEGGFPGDGVIRGQLANGAPRRRIGIRPDQRAPARQGVEVRDRGGRRIGAITSGGYGPSAGGPVAMGYVETASAAASTALALMVRGKARPARVVGLPFVPHRYAN